MGLRGSVRASHLSQPWVRISVVSKFNKKQNFRAKSRRRALAKEEGLHILPSAANGSILNKLFYLKAWQPERWLCMDARQLDT